GGPPATGGAGARPGGARRRRGDERHRPPSSRGGPDGRWGRGVVTGGRRPVTIRLADRLAGTLTGRLDELRAVVASRLDGLMSALRSAAVDVVIAGSLLRRVTAGAGPDELESFRALRSGATIHRGVPVPELRLVPAGDLEPAGCCLRINALRTATMVGVPAG